MSIIADLHLHSRFSRACSSQITIPNLEKYAKIKGLNLLGTGDFTHPLWLKELKEQLKDDGSGILKIGSGFLFVLSSEVANIFTQAGKGRRVHNVILAPSFDVVDQINEALSKRGRLDYDGRPMFGFSCAELVRMMKDISDEIEVIPAHCLPPDAHIHIKGGTKCIEEIEIGDEVFTHTGSYKRVIKKFSRQYTGKMHRIIPWYFREGISATPEHPFYIIKSRKKCPSIKGLCKPLCSKAASCKKKFYEKYTPSWIPAGEIEIGDFIVYPRPRMDKDIDTIDMTKKIRNHRLIADGLLITKNARNHKNGVKGIVGVDKNFCRLIGYYLAEGYTIRKEAVGFSFSRKESEYVKDVISLVASVFGISNFKMDQRRDGQSDIIFYSGILNEFFNSCYCGHERRAWNKSVPQELMLLPKEKSAEILRGWWRGDGGYTTSRTLANQMKMICMGLGIIPSISIDTAKSYMKRGNHRIGERKISTQHDLFIFSNLSFFENDFNMLKERCFRKSINKLKRKHGWIDGKYAYLPVKKIDIKEYSGEVHNLEVYEDNSYTAEFACAHNCWTPWYGVFGSESGFDSLKDAFQDQEKHVHAIETGMSSSPEMNWHISELNSRSIVSFSDAHCVHPNTLITLQDGYVLPISEIANEPHVSVADVHNIACKTGKKIQHTMILSPKVLRKIKFSGGEITSSHMHRFFVYENGGIKEKFASGLKCGDMLLRLARMPRSTNKIATMKKPKVDVFYSLKPNGLGLIKKLRRESGLTQKRVAGLIGLYIDHYWKIENGVIDANRTILKKMSRLLRFDLERFLDENAIQSSSSVVFPERISPDLCEFMGYFIGDGCFVIINRGKCLILTDKNVEMLKYYRNMVKKLFASNSRLFRYKKHNSDGLIIPSHVARFFSENFPEMVMKGGSRRVPRTIYSLQSRSIAGLLRGYFDAEGSIDDHGIKATSANRLLLCQIDSLLKKLGIYSSIYLNQMEKTKRKYRHNIILYGENLRKFEKNVGFNHPVKKAKLRNYIEKLKINRKSRIRRVGDFVLSEISSVEDVPSDTPYLYDIAVSSNENYIAEQVVVHNSFWPWRLGREATIFEKAEGYSDIINAIRKNKIAGTVETDPAYGKYHYDGHRLCNFSSSPEETRKLNGICPVCKKGLIIGVENRVEHLTDQAADKNPNRKPYYKMLPLHEIISAVKSWPLASKKTWEIYNQLIENFGNEFNVLLHASRQDLAKTLQQDSLLVDTILKNREGKINIKPGYDGVYGSAIIGQEQKSAVRRQSAPLITQRGLSDFARS